MKYAGNTLAIRNARTQSRYYTAIASFGKYLQKLYKAAGAGNGKYSIRTNKKVLVIVNKKQVQYELTWNKAAKLIHTNGRK